MRDPNMRLSRKIGGPVGRENVDGHAPAAKKPPIPAKLVVMLNAEGVPDKAKMEKAGLLPTYLRAWNNPAFLGQLKAVAARLKADKVDIDDEAAVKAWCAKHAEELESGDLTPALTPVKTVVNDKADVGRNDPCPCGSGKKFKKCCANK